ISGKTGEGVREVLEELIARVPPPQGDPGAAPRALIFDSEFDQYRGVIAYVRVVDGAFRKGEPIRAMATGTEAEIDDIGFFSPQMMPSGELGFGFRCGFLGLLHMDIVRERLEREYDLERLATMPSVGFEVTTTAGSELEVHNPSDMPDPGSIAEIREPLIEASVIAPR